MASDRRLGSVFIVWARANGVSQGDRQRVSWSKSGAEENLRAAHLNYPKAKLGVDEWLRDEQGRLTLKEW